MNITEVFEPVAADMAVVEKHLCTNLIDDNMFVDELLGQVFRAGGKRIRPGLVLLCHHATAPDGYDNNGEDAAQAAERLCNNDDVPRYIILAVLTELIHSASLVHDDVIDGAQIRRGQQTVHNKWNERVAVLLGDLLFAQASICLSQLQSPKIVGIYGRVLGDLCAGEIRQLRQQYVLDIDWEAYTHKSYCKTASLFSAGCRSAAILNESSDEIIGQLEEYGKNLGICFQIVDDLLDFTGNTDTLGKKAGGDLEHGILTAPALIVLERRDKPALQLAQLISSRAVNSDDGRAQAVSIIRNYGGIEGTQTLCRKYAEQARNNLLVLARSKHRDSLIGAIENLLHRVS